MGGGPEGGGKTGVLQQGERLGQLACIHPYIQIAPAAPDQGPGGLQGQGDALEHQHRDRGLLKQAGDLAGEAGQRKGPPYFMPRHLRQARLQQRKTFGQHGIGLQHTDQALALDRGQELLARSLTPPPIAGWRLAPFAGEPVGQQRLEGLEAAIAC